MIFVEFDQNFIIKLILILTKCLHLYIEESYEHTIETTQIIIIIEQLSH